MSTQKQYCYTHSSGKDIYLFTLRNHKGTEVLISNYGGIITSFKVTNKGVINDIVLGFDRMEEYLGEAYLRQYPWFGCAVGRYANRIRNAEFVLGNKKFTLSRNRGRHQLHGGKEGFDKKVWDLVALGDAPHPVLELKYYSADGEEGFPGNLETLLRFELNEGDELIHEYRASADQPTAVNLTHHSYFNLNNGQGTIHDHELRIPASRYLEQDEELVVTGNYIPIAGTTHDFRKFYRIGDGLARLEEYDQSFVVDKDEHSKETMLVAQARSAASGIGLDIYSTEPIVHFYSGKWTPLVTGKNDTAYGPFSGFCLETHIHPNAINVPHFPNTILRRGETYYQKTIYKIVS